MNSHIFEHQQRTVPEGTKDYTQPALGASPYFRIITKKRKKRSIKDKMNGNEILVTQEPSSYNGPSIKRDFSEAAYNDDQVCNRESPYRENFFPSIVNESQKQKISFKVDNHLTDAGGTTFLIGDNESQEYNGTEKNSREEHLASRLSTNGSVIILPKGIDEMCYKSCVIVVKEKLGTLTDDLVLTSVMEDSVSRNGTVIATEDGEAGSSIVELELNSELLQSGSEQFVDHKSPILATNYSGPSLQNKTSELVLGSLEDQYKIEIITQKCIKTGSASTDVGTTVELESKVVRETDGVTNTDSVSFNKIRCRLCSQTFSSLNEARQHAKIYHGSAIYEQKMRKRNSNSFFQCPECDRSFPTEKGKNRHHSTMHLKNKPSRCSECNLTFRSFRVLEKHLSEIHTMDHSVFCEFCDEGFILGISLECHKKLAHANCAKVQSAKISKCQVSRNRLAKSKPSDYCPSKNDLTEYFNNLVPQHTSKNREFECPVCNKIFASSKSLASHNLSAHNSSTYCCSQCKFGTKSVSALKRHQAQVHKTGNLSLYTCTDCKSAFQVPEDLEEHYVSIHQKPQISQCLLCGESFACKEMLRFHKSKHCAFTCMLCHLGFMKEETLEEHVNTVHRHDLPKETDELFEVTEDDQINDSPVLEIPQSSDERDSISKVLEINCDGSFKVRDSETDISTTINCNEVKEFQAKSEVQLYENKNETSTKAIDIKNPLRGFSIKNLPKKINCPLCNKLLTTKFFRTHMLSHRGHFPHKCHVCDKAYAQGTLLRKHMKNRHYEEFLKMGNKNPKKKEIVCEYCDEIFQDIFRLEDHLWNHMDEKNYKCETCGIKFGMKSSWMEHYRNHYFREERKCPSCNRAFKSIGFYSEHTARCLSNWKCEDCQTVCVSEELYRKHKRIAHLGKGCRYDCQECGKSFIRKANYEDHIYTHSSERKFPCSYCYKVYKRRIALQNHIQRAHSDDNHICSYCGFKFNSAIDLQMHKNEHRQEISCSECGALYLSQQTLDNHVATSHNILETQCFICPNCSEVFKNQIDLKSHLPSHFSNPIFICQVSHCHKDFKTELLLRMHMSRVHSHLEYYCHFCLRKYLLESDLQKHMVEHTENSLLKCLKCKCTFGSKSELQLHMSSHTDDAPYECILCGAKLLQKQKIQKHVETVHGITTTVNDYISVSRWKCSVCEKLLMTQNSIVKHLKQHGIHGTHSAEGTLVKLTLSQQTEPVCFPSGNAQAWWEDLIPSLKVQLVSRTDHTEQGGVTVDTWQCPVCFIICSSEENIKKHLFASKCPQTLLLSLTKKLSKDKECPDTDLHYVFFKNELLASAEEHSKEGTFVVMENGLQIEVDDGAANISEFLSPEDSTRNKHLLGNSRHQSVDQEQVSLPPSQQSSILNSAGVFVQVKDGQFLIPELSTAVTQYQLVNEDVDEQGTVESTYEIM